MKYEVTQDIGVYKKGQVLEPGHLKVDAVWIDPKYLTWLKPIVEKTREELEEENKKLREGISKVQEGIGFLVETHKDDAGKCNYYGGKHHAYTVCLQEVRKLTKDLPECE